MDTMHGEKDDNIVFRLGELTQSFSGWLLAWGLQN
jgi:hypothetical protein